MIIGHTSNTDIFSIDRHKVDEDLQRAADILYNIFTRILQ